jgi:hypothetical protein
MSGQEIATVIGATGAAIAAILGGMAQIQRPVRKKLEEMDKARIADKREQDEKDDTNAQVHRTIVCGQLAVIKALRQKDPSINGKVAEFERQYEYMLEFDCPPAKPHAS